MVDLKHAIKFFRSKVCKLFNPCYLAETAAHSSAQNIEHQRLTRKIFINKDLADCFTAPALAFGFPRSPKSTEPIRPCPGRSLGRLVKARAFGMTPRIVPLHNCPNSRVQGKGH